MAINISVHGSPVSIRRRKLFISDIETLKKNEFHRRRRLRLEQVRQQSKDIANQVRQRVRRERDNQLCDWEEKQRAELNKQQARRLLMLQQQYQDCLDEIGMGHLEAALEPDPEIILEAERERIHALAEERGREATAKLKKDLAEAEEKKNAARKQQEFSRTIENIRSSVIVSMGKSMKRTPKKSRKGKKKKKKPSYEIIDDVPPPPSKSWTIPFDEDVELHGTDDETTPPTAPEDVDSSESSSESSSEDSSASSSSSSSSSTGGTELRVQQSRVHFYDHGSRYEREYDRCAPVERIAPRSTEPDANIAAEIESQRSGGAAAMGRASYTRIYSRGNQALARERLHRDYKQLLGDLHVLAREERLIRGTREHGLPPEIFYEDYRRKEFDNRRQRNMDSAFESIYHRSQMDSPVVPESPADTIPTQPQWESAEQDDTPAKLNVADYQKKSPVDLLNVYAATGESRVPGVSTAVPSEQVGAAVTSGPSAASDENTAPQTSAAPAYKLESLEELIERVRTQQALLLEEIRDLSETPDSPPPAATEESSHIADAEVMDNENDSKSESDARETAKHDKMKGEGVKTMKPHSIGKCKERDKKTKEEKPAKKVDKVICESDNGDKVLTEVHSEYSYELSVVESSNASGSSSYEGVKTVISVSELSQKLYRSSQMVKSPQKIKHYDHSRKICKKRHKTPEKQLIGPEKEHHVDKDSKYKSPRKVRKQEKSVKDVREKGTMTTDFEFSLPDKTQERIASDERTKPAIPKTDVGRVDGDKNWKEVLGKSTLLKKDSSGSTLYMSPPEQFVSSNIEHIANLLAAVREQQKRKDVKTSKMNPLLVHYISRLLAMSRESIENLGMSSSDISTPDIESSSAETVTKSLGLQVHPDQTSAALPRKAQHVPGTSTPQEEEPDQHLDVITSPFESSLKDVTLEAMKFPDIFPEYSKRCSRISNLAKRIEQIRDEQRRLMNSISTSSSSSSSGQDYDSTRYVSPPESVMIMPRLGSKGSVPQSQPVQPSVDVNGGKENVPPRVSHTPGQCRCFLCCRDAIKLGDRDEQNGEVQSSQSFYVTPPESTSASNQELGPPPVQASHRVTTSSHVDGAQLSANGTTTQPSFVRQLNKDISGTYLQGVCGLCPQDNSKRCDPNKCLISREPRPHTRPPSTSIQKNFQSDRDNVPLKELSTIIEGDSTVTSIGKEQQVTPADTSDDSLPDVLSEMLSRKLITSPPSWLQTWPDNSSSSSHSGSDGFIEANFFTYLGQKSEELSQILREGFRKTTSKVDLPRLIVDVFSRLGKNPSQIEIDQAFKKIGLRWFPHNDRHPTVTCVDVTTDNFRDQVYKFFKGLSLDSSLRELENAFQQIGIIYPDASLRRNSNDKSVSFSPSTVESTSTGSALLPPIPTSVSVSTDDLSLSQDAEPST